jgi:glyoxylase-like metal-dependent hydrolase (beta-lactamase superfamily II)
MKLLNPVKVADGVFQVRAVGARVTAVTSGDGIVLVDAGGRGSVRSIAAGLNVLGYSLDKVRLAVLTHYHPDHFGGLGRLVEATGARVAVHRLEADIVRGVEPIPSPYRWPPLAALTGPVIRRLYGTPVEVDHRLDDGDLLPTDENIRVVHTPGHTDGTICLYLASKKVLIVSDALQHRLGRLSPPAAAVTKDPKLALESLKKLLPLDIDAICFGHHRPLQVDAHSHLERLLEKNGHAPK